MRPDRTILAALKFIRKFATLSSGKKREAGSKRNSLPALGPRFVDPVTDTIEEVIKDSKVSTPMVYLLSAGSDPTDGILAFARRKKISSTIVSLGEGQSQLALRAMTLGSQNGGWVLLQNCHLGLDFVENVFLRHFNSLLNQEGVSGSSFRVFLTTEPHSQFPIAVLQASMKVTNEPPAGLRAGLLHSYSAFVDQEKLERVDTPQWRTLLFALCFMHSTIMERRKFGSLGWCIPYEFNMSDLSACATFLEKHLYAQAVSWPTLQYIVGEVQYGGKITDDHDRILFTTICQSWLTPTTLSPQFSFNPMHMVGKMKNDFVYSAPDGVDIDVYRNYISTFPDVDSPEIFGLHPNADMTYRMKEVTSLLNTIIETQPKQSQDASGGHTREKVVLEKVAELHEKLPQNFVVEIYQEQIQKQGGLAIPLNIFLYQEVQRLDSVISAVRMTLENVKLAIHGEVTLTAALDKVIDAVFDAKVPESWIRNASGLELSWLSPNLGSWYSGLLERHAQLNLWLQQTRPSSYWLAGFFNPQGFLTAMRQEVTRAHVADRWSLDDVVFHTEVTEYVNAEAVKKTPGEGVFINGLFLDGCSWSRAQNSLVESEPGMLFSALPILYVTAVTSHLKKGKSGDYGPFGGYKCPLYKYSMRQDRYKIVDTLLPTRDLRPQHWILRGGALLCQTNI